MTASVREGEGVVVGVERVMCGKYKLLLPMSGVFMSVLHPEI